MSLYIVSTPIGNLGDITLRALDTIKIVELILAEDTRRTYILLKCHNIANKPLMSYNDYNKKKRTIFAINLLKQGKPVALVSDSGTPCISDPGFYLVRECIRNNIAVIPIPGASSIIAALVCSGLPSDSFSFYGFLPKSKNKRLAFFESIKESSQTIIFFESPYRIKATLEIMNGAIPTHTLVIARELTKKFEEFIRGTVTNVHNTCKDKDIKGELVVLLKKAQKHFYPLSRDNSKLYKHSPIITAPHHIS